MCNAGTEPRSGKRSPPLPSPAAILRTLEFKSRRVAVVGARRSPETSDAGRRAGMNEPGLSRCKT